MELLSVQGGTNPIDPANPEEISSDQLHSSIKNEADNKNMKTDEQDASKPEPNWHSPLAEDDEADDLLPSHSGKDNLESDWHSPLADDDEADDFNSNL